MREKQMNSSAAYAPQTSCQSRRTRFWASFGNPEVDRVAKLGYWKITLSAIEVRWTSEAI